MECNQQTLTERRPLQGVENQDIIRATMEDKENIINEDEDDDEDEVFFGDVSDKEKRKAEKFSKRRTIAFTPGFRNDRKLMRYTMDPSRLASLSEEASTATCSEGAEDNGLDQETDDKENICELNGLAENETTNGNSEVTELGCNNGNNSNNMGLDTSEDLFDSINELSDTCTSSQETNGNKSGVDELIDMVPKLDLSPTEKALEHTEQSDEPSERLTVDINHAKNGIQNASVLDSSNDPIEFISKCTALPQVSEQDTSLPNDVKKTFEVDPENNTTIDGSPGKCTELGKDVDLTENTSTEDPSLANQVPNDQQVWENNATKKRAAYIEENCANDVARLEGENMKTTMEQAGEFVMTNSYTQNEKSVISLEPVESTKKICNGTTGNDGKCDRLPKAPNSARIGFKRSSTSAFQVTPRKVDLWSSLPNLNFDARNGSSAADEEPVSPSVVFTETNFSPTLKVKDIKRPNTLFVDPVMMGNSQLSFDIHEKEINALEIKGENLLKPFVPGENEEQYSDSGLPSTPSAPFDFPRFHRSSWSDSVLRSAPELITEEPFPKLDFDIDEACRTPESDMQDILAKKKAQLDQLRQEKLKIQQRLVFKQGHNSRQDLSNLEPRSAKSHCPMPTASSLPRVRYKDTQALSLASKELEAVTQLHTLTNSHRSVKVIKKPRSANTKHVTVMAREASRLQWLETVATPATLKHMPNRKAVSATRPILHQRPMDYTYPYHEEQPAIVVVSKSRRSSTGGIHTKPLPLVDELETGLKRSHEK